MKGLAKRVGRERPARPILVRRPQNHRPRGVPFEQGLPDRGGAHGNIAPALAHCYPATILGRAPSVLLLHRSVANRHA